MSDRILDVGEAFAVVESVKAASEVHSPVAGQVVEVNQALADEPELLNEDTAEDVSDGGGWICKVELAEGTEVEGMSPEEYKKYLEGQSD